MYNFSLSSKAILTVTLTDSLSLFLLIQPGTSEAAHYDTLLKFQIQSILRGRPKKLTKLQNGSKSQIKHQRRTGKFSSWFPRVISETSEVQNQINTAQKTTTGRDLPSR